MANEGVNYIRLWLYRQLDNNGYSSIGRQGWPLIVRLLFKQLFLCPRADTEAQIVPPFGRNCLPALMIKKRKLPAQIYFLNTAWCGFLCLSASLFLHPQGDGQTWNNHTITPGHTNGECTARNVVSNAAHATHNGSSLSRRMDTNLF